MFKCECENACHFKCTDNNHDYGKEFPLTEKKVVKTEYGTFTVCKACYSNHLKEWEIN